MRQVTRKGLLTAAAAGGMLAMSTGAAHADAEAAGGSAKSPGVLSGNAVQAPVHVPVQLCGNTINIVGALNPAYGNQCASGSSGHGAGPQAGGGQESAGGSQARGRAQGSPGVASGNAVQAPVQVPVQVCGNNVSAVGAGNEAMGNTCVERPGGRTSQGGPQGSHVDSSSTRRGGPQPLHAEVLSARQVDAGTGSGVPAADAADAADADTAAGSSGGQLAETGSGSAVIAALPLGAGLLFGGVVLYRRRATAVARRG